MCNTICSIYTTHETKKKLCAAAVAAAVRSVEEVRFVMKPFFSAVFVYSWKNQSGFVTNVNELQPNIKVNNHNRNKLKQGCI